jgi:two-component system nitrogen regulation response regulator GlnG
VRVIAATHQNLEDRVKQGVFREDLFHRLNVIRLRLPALRERREDIPVLARYFLAKSAKDLGVDAKRFTEAALKTLSAFDFPGNVRQLENICHWLTVMAPAQVIEPKDLPPELMGGEAPPPSVAVPVPAAPAATAMPAAVAEAGPEPVFHAALPAVPMATAATPSTDWLGDLEQVARRLLANGSTDVWDQLTRQFEGKLILTALDITRGRRIEAAQKLGIGRNTITRKIQDLGLDD